MASGTATETLYLVDAHSLIFQVFHAIRGMTSPSGVPTNALFGFARDLLYLRSVKPTYLVCAFDRAEPTFRSAIFPEYKAHRDEMPSDLQLQLPHIHRLLEAMNMPVISVVGFEADDVLATLATAGAQRGLEVYLCTSDKDCRQLIGEHVRLYNLRKRQEFGREELLTDWGVTPEQVVDLQTLVGDSVDNVPGVPGIGLKTAAKLLQDFGTLESILTNIERIPGAKRQENLRNSGALIERTRRLVRLDVNVPIELDWDSWRLRDMDGPRLQKLCQEWGFNTLAHQFREASRAPATAQNELFAQEELFPFGANAPADAADSNGAALTTVAADTWKATYHLVDNR
jgi:DNA polymerase-1